MKKINKYAADDGSEFFSKKDCTRYENLYDEVHKIMSNLQSLPEDKNCEFINGAGYIQHDAHVFKKVYVNLLEIAYRLNNHKIIKTAIENPDSVNPAWVARIVSYNAPKVLDMAFSRMMNIDRHFREWGQPYFVTHPNEATHFVIKESNEEIHDGNTHRR